MYLLMNDILNHSQPGTVYNVVIIPDYMNSSVALHTVVTCDKNQAQVSLRTKITRNIG